MCRRKISVPRVPRGASLNNFFDWYGPQHGSMHGRWMKLDQRVVDSAKTMEQQKWNDNLCVLRLCCAKEVWLWLIHCQEAWESLASVAAIIFNEWRKCSISVIHPHHYQWVWICVVNDVPESCDSSLSDRQLLAQRSNIIADDQESVDFSCVKRELPSYFDPPPEWVGAWRTNDRSLVIFQSTLVDRCAFSLQ